MRLHCTILCRKPRGRLELESPSQRHLGSQYISIVHKQNETRVVDCWCRCTPVCPSACCRKDTTHTGKSEIVCIRKHLQYSLTCGLHASNDMRTLRSIMLPKYITSSSFLMSICQGSVMRTPSDVCIQCCTASDLSMSCLYHMCRRATTSL